MYIYIYICVCVYVCMYVCVYMCVCIYIYIYICVCGWLPLHLVPATTFGSEATGFGKAKRAMHERSHNWGTVQNDPERVLVQHERHHVVGAPCKIARWCNVNNITQLVHRAKWTRMSAGAAKATSHDWGTVQTGSA